MSPMDSNGMTVERVEVNGVSLETFHAGEGPAVLLLHGFPELAYSWRHQVAAVVDAGYHVIVPNQRGYGGSSRPGEVSAYNIFELVGDVVGLADHFEAAAPVVVGHDWGALVAWHCALFRPDLFGGVMAMSVPYLPRGPLSIVGMLRAALGDSFNYILYFQQPGVAEAELDVDPGAMLHRSLWGASGDRPRDLAPPDPATQTRLLEGGGYPDGLPPWISEEEFAVYVDAFSTSGYAGGINWYRNFDLNHSRTAPWHMAPVSIPSAFVGGLEDFVVHGGTPGQPGPSVGVMEQMCSDHRGTTLLEGIGHWNQQEAPDATNAALLAFLESLRS